MRRKMLSALVLSAVAIGTPAGAASEAAPQPARIDRDAMGVPHVFAATSEAVLFGAGYALAQDRLADMELARRRALGRTAEVLGPSAVQSDVISRDRLLDAAELLRMYRAAPDEYRRMMQAYVDGINHAIAEIERDPAHKTPYQFIQWGVKPARWSLLDFLAMIAAFPRSREGNEVTNLTFLTAMIQQHGVTAGRDIFDDVVPVSDPESPTAIPAGEDRAPARPLPVATDLSLLPDGTAGPVSIPAAPSRDHSRCLVIGPQKSASGKVLMMEATADGPEIHLHGGGFDSAGFTTPAWGVPIMGRGPRHGWLVTSGVSDSTDTFAEKLDPKNPYRYWYRGQWRTMQRRRERIAVKGAAPVIHEAARTIHGPVVAWDKPHHVAYTQSYAERGHEIDNWVGLVDMQRARSLGEFDQAVARLSTDFGICYGDEDGRIGFWETGLQPKRAPGTDPRLPTPGTGDYDWQGFLAVAERPHMLDPKQGYIHSWNSKPTIWSREGDEARIGATFRTWLGNHLGTAARAATLLDMAEYNRQIWNAMGARDRTQTSPDFFAPALRAAAAHDPTIAEAVGLMLSWNGRYEDRDGDGRYDNPGLTLFRAWLEIAPAMLFDRDMGDWWKKIDADRYLKYQTGLLYRTRKGAAAGAPVKFDYFHGRPRDEVVAETVRRTIAEVASRFPAQPMTAWRMPVFWKYFTDQAEDPERPPLPNDDERSNALWAELGLGPKMVTLNGGEEWVGMMELAPAHPALYSITEAGGQNQFIDPARHGTIHLTDQVQMHERNQFKRIDMAADDVLAGRVTSVTIDYSEAVAGER